MGRLEDRGGGLFKYGVGGALADNREGWGLMKREGLAELTERGGGGGLTERKDCDRRGIVPGVIRHTSVPNTPLAYYYSSKANE